MFVFIFYLLINITTSESYEQCQVFLCSNYPQSCICVESGVANSECELFKCTCICDLHAGKCDYGCCCDPDCSPDQINRFDYIKSCAYEGASFDFTQMCYSSDELYGINPKSPMGGQSSTEQGLNEALCVEKKNFAFKSDYYTAEKAESSQIFLKPEVQKKYSYSKLNQNQNDGSQVDNYFDQNDTIASFYLSNIVLVASGPGYLQIPLPDFNGYCDDSNFAKFEVNQQQTACTRTIQTADQNIFGQQCLSIYSTQRFASNLYIAKSAATFASTGTATLSDVVAFNIIEVLYRNSVSGELTDVTEMWISNNCKTTAYETSNGKVLNDSSLRTSKCFFATEPQHSNLLNRSTSACINAVSTVQYVIYHESTAESKITNATAKLIVTDLEFSMGGMYFSQSFGIEYESSYAAGISQENGNIVKRMKSGNPGYNTGLPVLYGYLNSSNEIQEYVSGLSIQYPFLTSMCPISPVEKNFVPIGFGYDAVTGCILKLSKEELRSFCCSGASGSCLDGSAAGGIQNSPYVSSTGIPFYLNFTDGYIGIYGNADPLDITQWLQIKLTVPSDARSWNDKTGTCSNAFTGLAIKFLINMAGEKSNPQWQIIAATADIITSNLVSKSPLDINTTIQNFPLSTTVSFITNPQQASVDYSPPPPPVMFKVPYDVFYPFLTGSACRISNLHFCAMCTIATVIFLLVIG